MRGQVFIFLLRDGMSGDKLFRQPHRSQGRTARADDLIALGKDELGTAAANVEGQNPAVLVGNFPEHSRQRELGFFFPGDHFDMESSPFPGHADKRLLVFRFPNGAGRDGANGDLSMMGANLPEFLQNGQEFQRIFDWMSIQRNLKAVGTFAFQAVAKGNRRYLEYIPETLAYVLQTLETRNDLQAIRKTLVKYLPGLTPENTEGN